ncbi:unnamed protein product [Toxocara canis]|uniref:Uncharacterized protein n=1 Tax=Toxocara canis TaxID=6265 RepID=A0A183UTE1_TOXCA|nr:unnamed protein product [Toxocara canis]
MASLVTTPTHGVTLTTLRDPAEPLNRTTVTTWSSISDSGSVDVHPCKVGDRQPDMEKGRTEQAASTSAGISITEVPETDILDSSVSEEDPDFRERIGRTTGQITVKDANPPLIIARSTFWRALAFGC